MGFNGGSRGAHIFEMIKMETEIWLRSQRSGAARHPKVKGAIASGRRVSPAAWRVYPGGTGDVFR